MLKEAKFIRKSATDKTFFWECPVCQAKLKQLKIRIKQFRTCCCCGERLVLQGVSK